MGKILIVDDSSFQRKILSDMIGDLGHEPLQAESGQELLSIIEKDKGFDCICLDLLMPEMTGVEVLERLQEMDGVPPVIVISADIQVKKKERCLELGAKAFINKYIDKQELAEEFKKHLNL